MAIIFLLYVWHRNFTPPRHDFVSKFTALSFFACCEFVAQLDSAHLEQERESTMLTMTEISKTYADGTSALRSLHLHAQKGMLGLLGPNGAGKSSLLRTIATLQRADSGRFQFGDIDGFAQPMQIRRQLGYLPQAFGVYPHLSCFALLDHIAVLKGVVDKAQRRAQIAALLDLTNLRDVAHKAVAHFSGGMRQRFGIAQALLGDPSLIILDEPTAGLDPEERQRLHHLLVEISQTRLVLLSTHIVEDIEQLCQQVAILLAGKIVVQADTDTLVSPLCGKVWQDRQSHSNLPHDALVLSSVYVRGQAVRRIYLPEGVDGRAHHLLPVDATLQDRYFFELQQERAA